MNALLLGRVYDGSTLAFAPRTGQLDSGATTTSHADVADVFARWERQTAAFSPELKQRAVSIQFGDRRCVFTYPDSGAEPRLWVGPVLRSLSERWGVKPGWDSYDAKPTDTRYAGRILNHLFAVMRGNSMPPTMTPLWDGGVQATWHRNGKDLEIVVSAEEPSTYYFRNAATDEEEEEELVPNLARVRALIHQF
jgi:hypothetical protein